MWPFFQLNAKSPPVGGLLIVYRYGERHHELLPLALLPLLRLRLPLLALALMLPVPLVLRVLLMPLPSDCGH